MLQKSLTGRQEIWNRLSGQKSYIEMSRSKRQSEKLTRVVKWDAVSSPAVLFPADSVSTAVKEIKGGRPGDLAI